MSEQILAFVEILSAKLWKLLSTCPKKHFEEKFSSIEKFLFLIFLVHWAIFFYLVLTKFPRGFENCIPGAQRIFMLKKLFLLKTLIFNSFETLGDWCLAFWRKIFGKFCTIAFHLSIGTFLRKKVVKYFYFCVISDNDGTFRPSSTEVSAALSKLLSTCPEKFSH